MKTDSEICYEYADLLMSDYLKSLNDDINIIMCDDCLIDITSENFNKINGDIYCDSCAMHFEGF